MYCRFRFSCANLSDRFVQPSLFDSSAVQGRLNCYVKRLPHVFGDQKVTLHEVPNGCAISMAGAATQTIMDHVDWKTSSMAHHYIKLNQVFGSGCAGDLFTMPVDITDNYHRQNELLGFS